MFNPKKINKNSRPSEDENKGSAKKRFKFTGTGKIKRKHAFKSHILTKKGTKQKRNLTHSTTVDKTNAMSVKRQLCA